MNHCIDAHKRALGKWVVDNREIMPLLNLLFPITTPDGNKDALILMVPSHGYHGLIIKLSTKHSDPIMDRLREQGYSTVICTGWKAARIMMMCYLQQ